VRRTEYSTESSTVTKHVSLTLVQNNTFYSRENTPVSAPIRGSARQTSGDMFKQNQDLNLEIQKIKTKLHLPNMPRRLRRPLEANKRRSSSLLAGQRDDPKTKQVERRVEPRVKTRVTESKPVSEQETSDSNAHPFHFSTVANHQTIAL